MANRLGINTLYVNKAKVFIIFFLGAVFFLTFYLVSPIEFSTWHTLLNAVEKMTIGALIALTLMVLLVFRLILNDNRIRLTANDFLFLAYSLYILLHITIIETSYLNTLFWTENALLVALYICFRNIPNKLSSLVWFGYVLAALLQILYGLSVQTHWFAPEYGLQDIRGSFVNQGPFAEVIVCALILAMGLVLNYRKVILIQKPIIKCVVMLISLSVLALLFTIIAFTESRAAWLACAGGLLFYAIQKFSNRKTKNFFIAKVNKALLLTLLLVLGIGLSKSLYLYKKDSANGRILIWKVSSEMFYDRPITGHGINSFQSKYMNYQADYLKREPTDPYRYLAANNHYAFNEILRIGVEQGIVGIGVLVLVFYLFIGQAKRKMSKNRNNFRSISWTGLISIIIFGLFSYPMEILSLKIIAVSFLAILSGYSKTVFEWPPSEYSDTKNVKRKILFIIVLIGLFIGWSSTNELYKTCRNWNYALFDLSKGNIDGYILFSEKAYERLRDNGDFLSLYGKSLVQAKRYTKAIEVLNEAQLLIPSTTLYIDLGKSYEGIGNYKEAESSWLTASKMVPSLFYPEYLMVKMYYKIGQKGKAIKLAKDLLNNKKIKVHSIEVYELLEELKTISKEP